MAASRRIGILKLKEVAPILMQKRKIFCTNDIYCCYFIIQMFHAFLGATTNILQGVLKFLHIFPTPLSNYAMIPLQKVCPLNVAPIMNSPQTNPLLLPHS